MERSLDLSRQALASLAQVPRDVVRHVENDGGPYALSLAQNRLVQLTELHVFQHVVQLDLSGNQLESLHGIQALVCLESLNVARNSLTAVDALAALPRLRVLNVAGNKLVQLDALRQLKTLAAVDASYNSIAKWPQLGHLHALESIDLSSNSLPGFPVSVAVRLFPQSLRRLSLVKNEIHELCGIAALGMFLQNLQTIQLDANPVTQRVLQDGGCLDFLWVNLFANVAFATGSGVRRDDFVVAPQVVEAVEDAIEQGDETVLYHFLLTGTVPTQLMLGSQQLYPPAGSSWPHEEVTPAKPFVGTRDHRRTDNGMNGTRMFVRETVTPAVVEAAAENTDAATILSKESKMELWKRMMDERKAQDQRERAQLTHPPPSPPVRCSPPASAPQHKVPVVSPSSLRAEANIRAPEPVPPAMSFPRATETTVASPPGRSINAAPTASIEALASQVKVLNDHVTSMRKYVKVWVKREQLTREAAATRIQRCTRQRRWRLHLSTLIRHSRARRRNEYGVEPCSSILINSYLPRATHGNQHQMHVHLSAVVVQRHLRGWLSRNRVSRWMYYTNAAVRIQHVWRRRRGEQVRIKHELGLKKSSSRQISQSVVDVVASLATDVRQLQRVFVVQEQMLARQWHELACAKRLMEKTLTAPAVKLQSVWRGYQVRSRHGSHCKYSLRVDPREAEIASLRSELETLKLVVQRLTEKID